MCDTGRAGCNRQNAVGACRSSCHFFCFLRELIRFRLVQYIEEFLSALRREKVLSQIHIHQEGHQLCQNIQMKITVHRCSNHKEKIRRLAVRGIVVNAFRHCQGSQARSLNGITLAMGNRDALADCRGPFALAL